MAPVSSSERRRLPNAPGLFETLKDDICHVGADLKKRGWRREIGASFSGLEAFYLSDADQARLHEMTFISRWLHRLWWLVKGLLMKLTPARRVLLAIALVQIVSGDQRVQIGHTSFNFVGVGELMLIVILMLELKDKLIARQELGGGPCRAVGAHAGTGAGRAGVGLVVVQRACQRRRRRPRRPHADRRTSPWRRARRRRRQSAPAALLMVKLQATLRALAPQFDSLGDLGGAVNRIVQRDGLPNRFATLVYLVLTECSGEVRVLNGGHMPPVVVRAGALDRLPPGSMALGIMADATFTEQRVELSEGDALIVFSDGVSEAMNSSGDFFGDERIGAVIQGAVGEPAAEIGDRLLQALQAFVGDAPSHDDVSLMVLRRVNHA